MHPLKGIFIFSIIDRDAPTGFICEQHDDKRLRRIGTERTLFRRLQRGDYKDVPQYRLEPGMEGNEGRAHNHAARCGELGEALILCQDDDPK